MQPQTSDKQSYLAEFLSENIPFQARIASLTLETSKPNATFEAAVLLIEYLQLASQILLLSLNIWTFVPTDNSFTETITPGFKLLNPGSLFISQGASHELTLSLIAVSLLVIFCKYLNVQYIVLNVIRKVDHMDIFVKTWKIAFKLQGRVLYSLISSIWVSTIVVALQNGFTIPEFGRMGTVIPLSIFLVLEFIFTFGCGIGYYTILPTKSLLSSKSCAIQAITLSQKFVLQMLQIIFASISYTDDWTIPSLCLVFSLARSTLYFKTLPLYKLKGLYLQGVILMMITSLDIACFFQKVVGHQDLADAFNFVWIVWAILFVLLARMCYGYVRKDIFKLVLSQEQISSDKLIQKISFTRQLLRQTEECSSEKQAAYSSLINSTLSSILCRFADTKAQSENDEIDSNYVSSKNQVYQALLNYLESLQSFAPKDDLLKLYIAETSAKKLQLYRTAISSLKHLQHSSRRIIAINTTLVVVGIQELAKTRAIHTADGMNLYEYFQSQSRYMHAQRKILQQTHLQIILYQEMAKDSPDLFRIFNQAQTIDEIRLSIHKKINIMANSIPEYYTHPLLTCAYYHLIVNHSLVDSSKYLKIYNHRTLKYAKNFQYESIIPENSFQENNAFVLVSGQKESLGKIFYCTDSLGRIYGRDTNLLIGADVSAIAPLNRYKFDQVFSKHSTQKGSNAVLSQGFRGYCNNKAGYLIELEFYIDAFPILTHGFYYCILIRPISTRRNIIVLNKDGAIEGISQNLSTLLEIPKNRAINIGAISRKLKTVNDTFNYDEIEDLTTKNHESSSQGQEIKMKPFNSKDQKTLVFECRMTMLSEEQNILNLFTLEEKKYISNGENEIENESERNQEDEENKSSSPSSEEIIEDLNEGYIEPINSTRWELKKTETITTKRDREIAENNLPELFMSERTTSCLTSRPLLKPDDPQKKIEILEKEKLVSIASQDASQGDQRKDVNITQVETADELGVISQQEKISQTLNLALNTRYCWKPLKLMYIGSYLLLLAIGIEQIILRDKLDETIGYLKAKKEVLSIAQLREYSFVSISRVAWFIVDEASGFLNTSNFSTFNFKTSDYVKFVNTNLVTLTNANQNMQDNAGSLKESLRDTLFEKDTQLYKRIDGNYEVIKNLTNFQAADYIIQSCLKAIAIANVNASKSVDLFKFFVNSSVNDLLVKTESTNQLFTNSIDFDTHDSQRVIRVTYYAFTGSILTALLILMRVIVFIYNNEKSNMLALVKLDPVAISKLQYRLDTFKKLLETASLIENKDTLQSLRTSVFADFQRRFKNKSNLQSPQYKGMVRKYVVYGVRSFLFACLVSGLMAWSSFSASNYIGSIHTENTRLEFLSNFAKFENLAYVAYRILFSNDDAMKVRGEPSEVQLEKALDILGDFRNQIIYLFQNDDMEYDPVIESVLFDHQCNILVDSSPLYDYCGVLKRTQSKMGLVSLVGTYAGMLKENGDSYSSSNKTVEALRELIIPDFDALLIMQRVVMDQINTIKKRTNTIFDQKFADSQSQAKLILIILLVVLSIVSYLIWVFIFRPLIQSNNRFKVVLKNYPANLILSNFLLKMFLIKTSGTTLDPIKSHL